MELRIAGVALALTLSLFGEANAATIKIGSKNFTEQFVVAEIYAQALEKAGFTVERHLNLGATAIAQAALVHGDIDLYPEYTGTAMASVVKGDLTGSAEKIFGDVKAFYEAKFQLTWLTPTNVNNGYAMIVKPDLAEKFKLKTLSDLSAVSKELVFGAEAGYSNRADGLPGLKKAYNIEFREFKNFASPNFRYTALLAGNIDVSIGFGTDWQIADKQLVVLDDDKHLWPPYYLAPVVRQDVIAKNPQLAEVLNKVSPLLTSENMRALNAEVDRDKEEPADVAKEFLVRLGL
ncbi:glycine betaine ABC transporter substrate-binding protein [Neorhizobium sp. Rsf11]|uniref:Glycine betaine ABC transporter substrate-binding protein n=2 Tax=Neorhizobium TaxID=1525371 RepID=A0ABV0MC22_9HYPH|nr:glycine betaine ABC transporter substrate-binding protein [Neorhizobium petrolearium]MCC2613736.1 ABC transporter [Neorhizobium petrolearium]WGI72048.1 glycine betaine ABC transporter substrate-binding protein [Neorhizobium petrolearium]